MKKLFLLLVICLSSCLQAFGGVSVPIHSRIGDKSEGYGDWLHMVNVGKRQQYSKAESESFDVDILSPKSTEFSPDGRYIYVNSLEGCKTVVYDAGDRRKVTVIEYDFPSGEGELWAAPSGYYQFTHYTDGATRPFRGKPVEMASSHGGRYLWVPFYRRSFDINAQDPSAVAVVDTRTFKIVRMFETGPLAKMIAVSPDNRMVAVTHWGDNTVGLIDISSADMKQWHHLPPVVVGKKFPLNYSLTVPVNRDSGSGTSLRGTIFSPDGKWLMVSAMGGPLSLIDVAAGKVVGQSREAFGLRHLATDGRYIYGSSNADGTVVRFPLDTLLRSGAEVRDGRASCLCLGRMERCKAGSTIRTITLSPDGKYIFAADNVGSRLAVIDAAKMQVVDDIRIDSYPVGLAGSPDGRFLAVTSQGKKDKGGGNAVNFIEIVRADYPDGYPFAMPDTAVDTLAADTLSAVATPPSTPVSERVWLYLTIGLGILLLLLIPAGLLIRRHRR